MDPSSVSVFIPRRTSNASSVFSQVIEKGASVSIPRTHSRNVSMDSTQSFTPSVTVKLPSAAPSRRGSRAPSVAGSASESRQGYTDEDYYRYYYYQQHQQHQQQPYDYGYGYDARSQHGEGYAPSYFAQNSDARSVYSATSAYSEVQVDYADLMSAQQRSGEPRSRRQSDARSRYEGDGYSAYGSEWSYQEAYRSGEYMWDGYQWVRDPAYYDGHMATTSAQPQGYSYNDTELNDWMQVDGTRNYWADQYRSDYHDGYMHDSGYYGDPYYDAYAQPTTTAQANYDAAMADASEEEKRPLLAEEQGVLYTDPEAYTEEDRPKDGENTPKLGTVVDGLLTGVDGMSRKATRHTALDMKAQAMTNSWQQYDALHGKNDAALYGSTFGRSEYPPHYGYYGQVSSLYPSGDMQRDMRMLKSPNVQPTKLTDAEDKNWSRVPKAKGTSTFGAVTPRSAMTPDDDKKAAESVVSEKAGWTAMEIEQALVSSMRVPTEARLSTAATAGVGRGTHPYEMIASNMTRMMEAERQRMNATPRVDTVMHGDDPRSKQRAHDDAKHKQVESAISDLQAKLEKLENERQESQRQLKEAEEARKKAEEEAQRVVEMQRERDRLAEQERRIQEEVARHVKEAEERFAKADVEKRLAREKEEEKRRQETRAKEEKERIQREKEAAEQKQREFQEQIRRARVAEEEKKMDEQRKQMLAEAHELAKKAKEEMERVQRAREEMEKQRQQLEHDMHSKMRKGLEDEQKKKAEEAEQRRLEQKKVEEQKKREVEAEQRRLERNKVEEAEKKREEEEAKRKREEEEAKKKVPTRPKPKDSRPWKTWAVWKIPNLAHLDNLSLDKKDKAAARKQQQTSRRSKSMSVKSTDLKDILQPNGRDLAPTNGDVNDRSDTTSPLNNRRRPASRTSRQTQSISYPSVFRMDGGNDMPDFTRTSLAPVKEDVERPSVFMPRPPSGMMSSAPRQAKIASRVPPPGLNGIPEIAPPPGLKGHAAFQMDAKASTSKSAEANVDTSKLLKPQAPTKPLVELNIETKSQGRQRLTIHKGDNPAKVAAEFCAKHGMMELKDGLTKLVTSAVEKRLKKKA